MKKTVKEVIIILIISTIAGFTANALSPKGIGLVGDYSERFAIDSASAKTGDKPAQKQRTKEGFIKPMNITVDDAKKLFDEGMLFIDGRDAIEYSQGHIKGAINIPYKEFLALSPEQKAARMKDIPKDRRIVSYCGGGDCEISIDNAYEFARIGYEDVSIYLGGLLEWKAKGYPTN